MENSQLFQAFIDEPLAITLSALKGIVSSYESAGEIQAGIYGAERSAEKRIEKIAIMPLFGIILSRGNLPSFLGVTSAESFGMQFVKLVNNPEIVAIVLDVDSPGGQIAGIQELSDEIYLARGKKPIVAVANHCMTAAAYWVASAADEIVITPSGEVGSIGVIAIHEDIRGKLEKEGHKISLISAGKYKTEGNPYEPLSGEAQSAIQSRVSEAYKAFVNTVARNRGVKPADVMNGFGQGRAVSANKAIQLGMADRIATLEEIIDRLLNGAPVLSKGIQQKSEDLRQQVNKILGKKPSELIKRQEYDNLSLSDRAKFIRSGGTLED